MFVAFCLPSQSCHFRYIAWTMRSRSTIRRGYSFISGRGTWTFIVLSESKCNAHSSFCVTRHRRRARAFRSSSDPDCPNSAIGSRRTTQPDQLAVEKIITQKQNERERRTDTMMKTPPVRSTRRTFSASTGASSFASVLHMMLSNCAGKREGVNHECCVRDDSISHSERKKIPSPYLRPHQHLTRRVSSSWRPSPAQAQAQQSIYSYNRRLREA